MPYILSPIIHENTPGMWFEGSSYTKKNIYSISSGKLPPVNYDEHTLRPHSLTHIETQAHTVKDGKTIDFYYENSIHSFFGTTAVLRLIGNRYALADKEKGIYHWIISKDEILLGLARLGLSEGLEKIIITTDYCPLNAEEYHDPNYVLTLSQEAADYLVSLPKFNLFGTSWKSSDFLPGSFQRPIHNTIFSKAIILENLKLNSVPEGIYFMSAFPLPFSNASESPVVPVLFTKDEIKGFI